MDGSHGKLLVFRPSRLVGLMFSAFKDLMMNELHKLGYRRADLVKALRNIPFV